VKTTNDKIPFREYHLLRFLTHYDLSQTPLDVAIHRYFRQNRALGSKDRAYIAATAYRLIRFLGLVDHLIEGKPTWKKRVKCLQGSLEARSDFPMHVKLSFPKVLFERLLKSFSLEEAFRLCKASLQEAPITIRVNPLKTTREALFAALQARGEVKLCHASQLGLRLMKRDIFSNWPEFREGLFEIQDEGSQCVADLVDAGPGDRVLDYCAGSGGKTLGFAHKLKRRGQIYLYDVRRAILYRARQRLKRAGIQNAQIVLSEDALRKVCMGMDWVLVDVPCTGTGTLRRNPDMKWRYSDTMLFELVQKQREIFAKALRFLKSGGHIVYATCSLLSEENQKQTAHFLKTHSIRFVRDFQTFPDDMDGFYAAVFQKIDSN